MDHEALHLRPRRGRIRRGAWTVDLGGAARPGPDAEIALPTLPQQALLYRLCGDRNPLHSDPAFAKAAGFDRPILHGLCTYGIGAKAIVDHFLDSDVAQVASYGARFAGTVIPGETLQANIWKQDGKFLGVLTAPSRDNAVVLSGVELIPT